MDLWNAVRYMSQLPADYLTNRISLPSQQAIVSSAKSYLEYSYVFELFLNTKFDEIFFIDFVFDYPNFL